VAFPTVNVGFKLWTVEPLAGDWGAGAVIVGELLKVSSEPHAAKKRQAPRVATKSSVRLFNASSFLLNLTRSLGNGF